jgi:hypothetical protein
MVGRFQKILVRPSLVQIYRLGHSAANITCGRILVDVMLWAQGKEVS